MLDTVLITLGLSAEEAEIYQSLLNHGPQTATGLGKTTKVKRTYVYRIVRGLISKGFVSQSKKAHTTVFSPNSPDLLLDLSQTRKQNLEQTQQTLENILPALKQKYRLVETKPVITYYEGVEGIKKVYLDTINEGKEILALVETSEVTQEIYDWVTTTYAKMRIKNNIGVKAIVASGSKTQTYVRLNKKELRETKVIPNNKYPIEEEINIYGDKLAIISHRKKTKPLGIIIDNAEIARTFRSWFHLTWLLLK